jgi:hypothetical protein
VSSVSDNSSREDVAPAMFIICLAGRRLKRAGVSSIEGEAVAGPNSPDCNGVAPGGYGVTGKS